ncbi:hypothetical protein PMI06_002896 [Burkholderia sp. BT03]|nr:hypothetical protein PMI06_002896 [Burkholderia sp. BT03]SKC65144.1 hypothetical protein SAMN06266956_1444 [Paraburkholderia hospita]
MMRSGIQYQSNIGGGDFQHPKDCFHAWKQQPLAYRMSQHRFEGKREVRPLAGDSVFEDAEVAQRTLAKTCGPTITTRWPHRFTAANATCGWSWRHTKSEAPTQGQAGWAARFRLLACLRSALDFVSSAASRALSTSPDADGLPPLRALRPASRTRLST